MKKTFIIFIIGSIFSTKVFAQSEFNINLYSPGKILNIEDLNKLLPVECELIKLELLAKNGVLFSDSLLLKHFKKQIWYKPVSPIPNILNQSDSINLKLLNSIICNNSRTIDLNIYDLIPKPQKTIRYYCTRVRETSDLKPIQKRPFGIIPFSYCKTMQLFKPEFYEDIPPQDFECFLDSTNFNTNEYYTFAQNNGFTGDLFRINLDNSNKKPFLVEELGIEVFNLGKVYGQYYLDSLNRVFLTTSNVCLEPKQKQMALINHFDNNNHIDKEILLIEDNNYLYVQITTKQYFIELGLPKNSDD